MKGLWTWPSDPAEQDKIIRKVKEEDELMTILVSLTGNPEGLSNAQLDKLLQNNSQWRTLSHVKELIALGFIRYDVQFFGDPGKYKVTDLGKTVVSKIQTDH